jgi:hypothetical protein
VCKLLLDDKSNKIKVTALDILVFLMDGDNGIIEPESFEVETIAYRCVRVQLAKDLRSGFELL